MYQLSFSVKFDKQLIKLVKSNSSLKLQVKKTVTILSTNINHPSLRLHKIAGENYWSVSVNKSIRMLVRINNDKIYFLAIGKHEDVY